MSDLQPKQIRPQLGSEQSNRAAVIFILAVVLIDAVGVGVAWLIPWLRNYVQ
ncbi:hypothetical protein RRSWK_05388 [Rhodopirellula sp. SWK7]|nr:hypothetical protein RRSWK_05388 [Rhodopirellula sp. SWK7]